MLILAPYFTFVNTQFANVSDLLRFWGAQGGARGPETGRSDQPGGDRLSAQPLDRQRLRQQRLRRQSDQEGVLRCASEFW